MTHSSNQFEHLLGSPFALLQVGYLQAIVCVWDLATPAILVSFRAVACVTGWTVWQTLR